MAPPGSSAVPARVACQARFASARVAPRQGRPPSPPGSPAKLLLRVPERRSPARRPRQGDPPSSLKDVSALPRFSRWEIRRLVLRVAPPGWPAKLVICECQSCAVPAAIARRNVSTPPSRLDRPRLFCGVRCGPSAPGRSRAPARVVRRPRQGRPPSSFCEYQNAGPARVNPPSSLKDVSAPPGFSRWEIRVPNFTIVPHG